MAMHLYWLAFGFSCLGSASEGISFLIFGTLVLSLHGTFGVTFVQHMTSFHCRFWPFLALLLDIIIDFGYPCFFLFCASVHDGSAMLISFRHEWLSVVLLSKDG
ncbi:transmembrane protein, putative [Medicago truncatula]|uniref:Transmembrane protein, putative n=1 Tax=Medicago truncatula TaxID=3880 RepID=G7LEP6_MEDTR|nr:transmembrane protein, putative [Medicago truncatula]